MPELGMEKVRTGDDPRISSVPVVWESTLSGSIFAASTIDFDAVESDAEAAVEIGAGGAGEAGAVEEGVGGLGVEDGVSANSVPGEVTTAIESGGVTSEVLPVAVATALRIAANESSEDCCRPSPSALSRPLPRSPRDPFFGFFRRAMRYCRRSWLKNMRADSHPIGRSSG